jgi:anti-sigma factor RsiW
MNCRDNESLILAERDGALTKAQLAALSDHVATCPACHRFRTNLATALQTYHAGLAEASVPNADEAWHDLQRRLNQPAKKRSLAPVIWFVTPLAAAAALAVSFFVTRPAPPASGIPTPQTQNVAAARLPVPLHDPSVIAGADFVEAGDPNASTVVYVDHESGWLVVWATDPETATKG